MSRSTTLAFACILIIAASGAYLYARQTWLKSPAAQARADSERRKCFRCEYEWSKNRGDLIRESRNAPPGYQFVVQCPKCKEWAGMTVNECDKCGKNYTSHVIVEDEDGNLSFPKQRQCPYCGHVLGQDPDAPSEPEPDDGD